MSLAGLHFIDYNSHSAFSMNDLNVNSFKFECGKKFVLCCLKTYVISKCSGSANLNIHIIMSSLHSQAGVDNIKVDKVFVSFFIR